MAAERAGHGNTTRRKSSLVWNDFDRVNVSAGTGAGATAKCNKCGSILSAGTNNGTSHLRRHVESSCCKKRAAERDAQWAEDLLIEPEYDMAGRLIIQGGDELVVASGDVAAAAAGDHGRLPPPDALPQATTSSSMRFLQKKRARSANLASQTGGTKDDNSSHAKDPAATVGNSVIDMDFTYEDIFADIDPTQLYIG